ncbi:cytochrome P460 family protein [Xanthobacter autotrophicus DSM 597]|uniref:cytochrome P460 family protein n=1 Tax=Xanthobacter wiegelii TaxID=3119913 RepID=UPI003728D4AB
MTLPNGYRSWELIAPAIEAAPLDELRAVLGNQTALDAYRSGTLPFPDGTVRALGQHALRRCSCFVPSAERQNRKFAAATTNGRFGAES